MEEALGWQPPGFGLLLGVVVPAVAVFLVFVLLFPICSVTGPAGAPALLGGGAAARAHQAVQVGLD